MNTTNSLINSMYKDLKAVQVIFDSSQKEYTYKTFIKLEVGDKCVVKVRDEFKIVTVVSTNSCALQNNYIYKWIVQKVETEAYDDMVARENEASVMLTDMLNKSRRIEAYKKIQSMLGEEQVHQLDLISDDLNKNLDIITKKEKEN